MEKIRNVLRYISVLSAFRKKTSSPEANPQDNIPTEIKEIHDRITSSESVNEEEISQLFQRIDPNLNFDVTFEEGNTLIHEAVIHKKPKILQELLLKHNFNLNVENKDEDTPMISLLKACVKCGENYWNKSERNYQWGGDENQAVAVEKKPVCEEHFSCLKVLLDCDKTIKNKLGLNAISYATMCPPKQRFEYLKILFNETTANQVNKLYKLLYQKCDSSFMTKLQEQQKKNDDISSNILNLMWKDMTGEYTLLQITCRWGMKKSMKYLLQIGAKIDHTPLVPYLPVQTACYFSHPDILYCLLRRKDMEKQLLVKTSKTEKNLLHILVKDINDPKKALECLQILLRFHKIIENINEKDLYGRTPLHYAVMSDDEDCIVKLLENGASLTVPDKWKETPLMNISRSAFKKFVDNMITDSRSKEKPIGSKLNHSDNQLRSIIFNFEKLIERQKVIKDHGINSSYIWGKFKRLSSASEENDPNSQTDTYENIYRLKTDFLYKIKNTKELEKLMAHPVFSIIIYFKWLKCRGIFLTCQISFLIFTILYTYFLTSNEQRSENRFIKTLLNKYYPKYINVLRPSDIFQNVFLVLLFVLLIIFALLEILKIIQNKRKYFYDTNNILRITGIFLSMIVLSQINTCPCSELKAISILITWLDFAFTVGEYPSLALYISIFRKALLRLMQFLIVYSGLLIGFSLSFHFLFGAKNSEFSNPFDAFFKTLGILSGDFGADNIPFHAYPVTSHVIFTLYICVTTMILINIMAEMIAKVKMLSDNPFLHKMLAQVAIIKHYEDNYLKNKFLNKIRDCFRRKSKGHANGRNTNDDFTLEIVLNGEKNRLKHHMIFETYPQEKVRIQSVDDDKSKISKILKFFDFVGLFEGVDDTIVQKSKKIIKEKSKKYEKSKKEDEILTYDKFTKEINELKQKISSGQMNKPKIEAGQKRKNRSI